MSHERKCLLGGIAIVLVAAVALAFGSYRGYVAAHEEYRVELISAGSVVRAYRADGEPRRMGAFGTAAVYQFRDADTGETVEVPAALSVVTRLVP